VQGYSVWKFRRALDWKKLWPFVAGAGVGVFLVLYSLYALFRPANAAQFD
jgi:uncharacterized protein